MSNFESQPPQQQSLKKQALPNRYGDESPELVEAPIKSPRHDGGTKDKETLFGQVSKALYSITPRQQNRSRHLMPMFIGKTQKEEPKTKQKEDFIKEIRSKFGKKDAFDKNKVTRNLKSQKGSTKVVKI